MGVTSLVTGGTNSLVVGVTALVVDGTSVEVAVTVIVRHRHVHFEADTSS